jgi:hypothetical protein
MKVTMTSVMCGPEGNAFQGTVVDIPKDRMQSVTDPESGKVTQVPLSEYLIANKFARPFDSQKDAKRPVGLIKAGRE